MLNRKRKSNWIEKSFFVSFIIIAFIFITCAKAPVTQRSQLILVPQELADQMGTTAFQEVLQKEQISNSPEYNEVVRRVGTRIVRASDTPPPVSNWEFKVIKDDKTINAFALPGGKVAVYTGILPIAKNDAGLATVLGHEIGHVAAHHGAERISAGLLTELGAAGLSLALGNRDPGIVNAVMQAYGVGVNVGAILPFSRAQEAEADKIGLIYMAKAGYDPREALEFWHRMEEATRNMPQPPVFLADHPSYGTRISNIEKLLPQAMEHYQRADKAPNTLISSSQ
jgi:metalloendopeptidase OMA1, mitochondrial